MFVLIILSRFHCIMKAMNLRTLQTLSSANGAEYSVTVLLQKDLEKYETFRSEG